MRCSSKYATSCASQRVRAVLHVGDDVGNARNRLHRLFPLQHQFFRRQLLVANLANDLGQVDGVFGFVIGLLREIARQIRVVAILTQFAFGIRQQLFRLAQRNRRVAADAGAVGVCQQSARFAQVLLP